MVEASSLGLANALTDEERSLDLLYPRIERSKHFHRLRYSQADIANIIVRQISAQIARQVIRTAQQAVGFYLFSYFTSHQPEFQGVDRSSDLRSMSDAELLSFVESKMWDP
jgi:malate dehydrogenase (oxaloacetate-decarboxylating)(NADP+)